MTLTAHNFGRKPVPGLSDKGPNSLGLGKVRTIRHSIFIGGVQVNKYMSWTKDETAYSAGSTCTLNMPLVSDFPIFALSQKHTCLQLKILTSIFIDGNAVFENVEEFCGVIDTITKQFKTGTLDIAARSYAQILLNAKVNDVISSPAAAKMTTTQVVQSFTAKYGQGLKVIADTFTTPVGSIFHDQLVKATVNVSVWDLFESFAQKDQADLFVKGDTLYYVKRSVDIGPDIRLLNQHIKPTYTYQWLYNIEELEIVHSPMMAHDITVAVKTYQPRTKQQYTATKSMSDLQIKNMANLLATDPSTVKPKYDSALAKLLNRRRPIVGSGKFTDSRISNKGNYVFTIPNASQEDCDRVAEELMREIATKEFLVTLKVLGQPDFNPRQFIRLANTGEDVTDCVYAIKNIHTESGVPATGGEAQGYLTTFHMVNHAVPTTGASFGM